MDPLPPEVVGLSVALGLGLLVGVERERRAADRESPISAGVRTFTLIALCGALAQLIGAIAIAVAGAFVVVAALLSYWRSQKTDPGLTSEVAMLAVFLLGILAMRTPVLAASLSVVVALILVSKSRLHRFARQVLNEQELHDGLLLAAAAAIVLPLLPDQPIDPWGVLNLHALWRLVVLIMLINAAGYIGLRILGPGHGLALAGLTGGFVSSTVTIGGMGSRVRATPNLLAACVTGALLSNVATVVLLAIVVGAVAPALLVHMAPGLIAAGLTAAVYALALGWRNLRTDDQETASFRGRPFQPSHALAFAAVVAVILLFGAWIKQWLGQAGLVLASAAAGFADVHAAAGSIGQMVTSTEPELRLGAIALLAAFSTNTISKIVVAFISGGSAYGWRLLPGLLLIALALAAPLLMG